jgi:hypothetical protein
VPSCAIIPVVFEPEFKKAGRVRVITYPGTDAKIEIELVSGIEIGFPFLLFDGDLDAEVFFPHVLIGFTESFGKIAIGGEQFGFWESFTVGVTRVSEELFCLLGIKGNLMRRVVTAKAWGESVGGKLPPFSDVIDDGLSVNGK